MTLSPLELVVLQPTPFCNINCTYCYLPSRSDPRRMSDETVAAAGAFIGGATLRCNPLTVVWHAGEPLVLGPEYYESRFRTISDACEGASLRQAFQTNAMLIDGEWCALFRKWRMEIGVSIDGPADIHDRNRVDRAGRGTFAKTLAGIECLRREAIPFSIIAVLTQESLRSPERMFEFFLTLGASGLAFNLEESDGVHRSASLLASGYRDEFCEFVRSVARLADEHPELPVRELGQFDSVLRAPPGSRLRKADNCPGAIITVDVDGNISTFSPELAGLSDDRYAGFRWGNVKDTRWDSFALHAGFRAAAAEIEEGVEACRRSCDYFCVCGGGAPSNKLAETGSFAGTETLHCKMRVKALTDTLLPIYEARARPSRAAEET